MGIDAGFDMVPRLSNGAVDRHNWQSFIKLIREHYQNDDLVEVKPNYLEFKAGEHPLLPFEGHKFLRFSSKTSGSHAKGVEEYIYTVTRVAQASFGSRVRYWNEACDEYGFYSWPEVHESFESYEQRDEPVIPTTIAQFVFGCDPLAELNLDLFEIKSLPDKGRALVARFNIAKGKRILCEKPLFTTENLSPITLMESNIATKLKTLSKTEQRQFLSLHNNFPGKHPFSGIVKTNALPCGPGAVTSGVYPTICLINHRCLPNAHNNWNSDLQRETIHAIQYIRAGDEITIPYDQGGSSSSRRTYLQNAFGFDCTCTLCSLSPPELESSDARRVQIQLLDDSIGNPDRVLNKPSDSLADGHRLLQLLDEEYQGSAGALNAKLYYDVFQICITHGDLARASVFAERGYKARVVCEGEDSPETRKVKELMGKPEGHGNFGVSMRWKITKKMVPKGLDDVEFDKWLWRQGR
ncbi:hypothetical protein G7Y89_g12916 [Cudoniella acicularis]|uniref:SET domain-containing protein n=1 Tax=Cudoniella acicularis TaxID=354080 RepID=A0A8H4RBQ1_9HELO|nr:hypothetical protein G7Y89_g12916 [Cudoniella acicularis]